MNTWSLVTLLLCFTNPARTADSEDATKVPENSRNQTSTQVTDKVSNEGKETVSALLTERSALHSSQPAVTEHLHTHPAVTKQPHTQPAVTEQPHTQPAVTEQPHTQPAVTERPQTQPAVTEPSNIASTTAEMQLKGNSSTATESPGSIELTEEQHHVDGKQAVGDCRQETSPGEMRLLGNAISKFGLDLFKEVLQETSKPNVIISPLSIALGLAQLSLGSANKTEKQLQETLHFTSLNCSHYTLCTTINSFTRSALSIASAIYIKKGFHIKPEFIEDSEKFYKSRPQLLSGINAKDTNMINNWVEQMTDRKIKTFFNEIPSNIVLLLLNAIHFKGLWQVQFDPRATSDDIFYKEDGSSVHVPMMQHPKYPISGFHDDDLQIEVARLSFKQNMSFIVVKPMMAGRLNSIVAKLNITELLARFFRARPMPVKVPKLNIDFDVDLSQALQSLGLSNLFTNPNLSKISATPLLVSSVQHKATMELKEEGVEAAATTGVAVSRSFLQCNINRPFFFLIRDDISGIPLFLGTIKDPKPQIQKESQDKLMVNLERMKKTVELVDPK
ncbi:alpha-2-antiplasmin-like [Heterodontus francisci]|uniref:alpha-2-antiplasmin-like n=1 Tax=Heterodontus francisci TaxID=7792 RepID=UPI00355C2945